MPVHDWTRVDAGLFHHFLQQWSVALCNALNGGVLPRGFAALVEQTTGGIIPDLIGLQRLSHAPECNGPSGSVAVAEKPPQARFMIETEEEIYAKRADRIAIRHRHGKVVAVIELVSPGNKNSRHAVLSFARKSGDILLQGIHLLFVDLFPPSARDPQGLHPLIWDEITDPRPFELPSDKPLTVAAYAAAPFLRAYIEPLAIGDPLPSLPIFLDERTYVPAPLEESYMVAWNLFPIDFRDLIESPEAR